MGLPTGCVVRLGLPADRFIGHASRAEQLAEVGLDAAGLIKAVRRAMGDRADDIRQAERIAAHAARQSTGSMRPRAQA
jgi:hypothetical protein